MNEYLILSMLFAVSLLILILLARMLLGVKQVEHTAEVKVVELEPEEPVPDEVALVDIEEEAEEKKEGEPPP